MWESLNFPEISFPYCEDASVKAQLYLWGACMLEMAREGERPCPILFRVLQPNPVDLSSGFWCWLAQDSLEFNYRVPAKGGHCFRQYTFFHFLLKIHIKSSSRQCQPLKGELTGTQRDLCDVTQGVRRPEEETRKQLV